MSMRGHHLRSFPRKRESTAKNWVPAFAGTSGVLSGDCQCTPQ
jgi:hypothetical protein